MSESGSPSSIDWQEAKAPKIIRILHVIPGLGLGGAETLLFELVRRQTEFEHSVVCLNGPGWFSDKLEKLGVRVDHLHMRASPIAAIGLAKLYQIIRREKPDLVQSWLYSANLLAGVAARVAGVPVIWGIHTCWSKRYRMLTRLFARAGGILASVLPERVINCSEAAERTHAELGYSNGAALVIHNGYDAGRFVPDPDTKAAVRRDLGISPDSFVIGSITRWTDYKDVPTLLRALEFVAEEARPFTCVLVGQGLGHENSRLAEAIRQMRCAECVLPLGRRLDVERVAAALDLHVLPSLTESFGNTIAETMLAGVPNVVTDCGGPTEVVGNTGWIVPTQDPQKMADAINQAHQEWSETPRGWEQRRAVARARVVEKFSVERMGEAYCKIWKCVGTARLLGRSQQVHRTQADPR